MALGNFIKPVEVLTGGASGANAPGVASGLASAPMFAFNQTPSGRAQGGKRPTCASTGTPRQVAQRTAGAGPFGGMSENEWEAVMFTKAHSKALGVALKMGLANEHTGRLLMAGTTKTVLLAIASPIAAALLGAGQQYNAQVKGNRNHGLGPPHLMSAVAALTLFA